MKCRYKKKKKMSALSEGAVRFCNLISLSSSSNVYSREDLFIRLEKTMDWLTLRAKTHKRKYPEELVLIGKVKHKSYFKASERGKNFGIKKYDICLYFKGTFFAALFKKRSYLQHISSLDLLKYINPNSIY